jgi:ABC-type antimicrobial peptide transport system permease subunit
MRKILVLFVFICTQGVFCQLQTDCDTVLSKEIILEDDYFDNLEKIAKNVSHFKSCGLDEVDIEIFTTEAVLGVILFSLAAEKETESKLTYRFLYDKIMEIKQLDDYKRNKSYFIVSSELSKRPATINNWKEDKILLQKLQITDDLIDKFYDYLKIHADPAKTYQEVFANFRESQKPPKSEIKKTENENEYVFKNVGNVNYEDLLKKAVELNKPLLIYFTCYACVNGRKMEHFVLNQPLLIEKLKADFYFVSLYLDDKGSLPENERIAFKNKGKLIKTIGQKHSELQLNKFNKNDQPYFVIIATNGIKIKEQGFTTDVKIFEDFLKIDK